MSAAFILSTGDENTAVHVRWSTGGILCLVGELGEVCQRSGAELLFRCLNVLRRLGIHHILEQLHRIGLLCGGNSFHQVVQAMAGVEKVIEHSPLEDLLVGMRDAFIPITYNDANSAVRH